MPTDTRHTGKTLIVLVEDEEIIANLLTKKLESAGYLVRVARDGARGLELIRELEPDLVLLDMMLPKLGGFGVLEKLYEARLLPKLPVIIISDSGQPIEIERAMKLGIRDYLIKVNFNPAEVLAKVDLILAGEAERVGTLEDREISAPRGHVLIVEDDVLLVDLLERKLAQEGYRAYRAIDAAQARRVLEGNPIDLILLDIVLPGTDGFSFLAELKAHDRFRAIPVIIISNLGQQEEVQRGLKAGATDYLIKAHSTPSTLVTKVNEVIGATGRRVRKRTGAAPG